MVLRYMHGVSAVAVQSHVQSYYLLLTTVQSHYLLLTTYYLLLCNHTCLIVR